jgi:hypothetical protein
MAAKKNRRLLTDRFLRSLPPAPRGKRDEVWDSRVTGFGIRISDTKDADPARRGKAGKITFICYPVSSGAAPARRTIGVYGADAMKLEDARRIAGEWRSQVARGIDPAVVEAERRAAEARERALRVKHPSPSPPSVITPSSRRSEAARWPNATCAACSSPHGRAPGERNHEARRAGKLSTPKSAARRRWPARCWS